MDYTVRDSGGMRELELRGQITFEADAGFREILAEWEKGGIAECVLDLSAVEYMDSAGLGLLGEERLARRAHRHSARRAIDAVLDQECTASAVADARAPIGRDGARRTKREWLRFPGVELGHLLSEDWASPDDALLAELIEDARYAPYLERQAAEVEALRRNEAIALPLALDYAQMPGLSIEMTERLSAARPTTLAAAARIRGITPAALSAILLHVRKAAA